MEAYLPVVALAIGVVLAFDYTNGFHDASNILSGVIASRAMTPIQAMLLVAVFEFLGPLLGGTAVADTVGSLLDLSVPPRPVGLTTVLSGLAAAVAWNFFTWWRGLPSSSSHALVGGLIGAALAAPEPIPMDWGIDALLRGHIQGFAKILLALFLSPVLGFAVGFALQRGTMFLLRAAHPSINRRLCQTQWLTAAGLAFCHGANDAQKSMGVLTLLLLLGGQISTFQVPVWVMAVCATAMTAGALTGGWRIVRTLGFAIYKIRPIHALNSQLTACSVITGCSVLGAPVSTTHVVASAITGIGASDRPRQVRWAKAGEIVLAWLITIPGAALLAALISRLAQL